LNLSKFLPVYGDQVGVRKVLSCSVESVETL